MSVYLNTCAWEQQRALLYTTNKTKKQTKKVRRMNMERSRAGTKKSTDGRAIARVYRPPRSLVLEVVDVLLNLTLPNL